MPYALHIFPEFADLAQIERIRQQYDPLFGLIPPHITLIFPFEADEEDLQEAMRAAECVAAQIPSFSLEMQPAQLCGDYLFLLCMRGGDEICRLHDALYKAAFAKWYAPEYPYEPHLTLGRGENLPLLCMEKPLRCTVRQVVMERIEPDERSTVIRRMELKED